ncbi:hypothetical protein HPB49_003513 [Dermacentor silvarum]|uniref:Uncharacterized protein n=1 Tax=Dermacentor silvarum TaxID=543639 RepID=A0ACB8DTU2_DERSI|nr:hypothetical protein HPB49_003513 [Dermacentor silvarum]
MYQGLQVSTSTINRLLDDHCYTLKLATPRPADRNRSDVKRVTAETMRNGSKIKLQISPKFMSMRQISMSGVPEASPGQTAEHQLFEWCLARRVQT